MAATPNPTLAALRRRGPPRRRATAVTAAPTVRRSVPATTTTSPSSRTRRCTSASGCGNPTAVADLQPGDTVLDLGSGGGIDVLLSARRVGPTGFAYGLDATAEMLDLARRNATEAGATNVEFLHGTIEHIPLDDASVDVVISNCVIVLVRRQGRRLRRDRPGAAPGRPCRDQRHRPRQPDDGTPTGVDVRATAHHRRRLRRRPSPRRARPRVDRSSPTRIGGGLSNAIIRATKPAVTIRPMRDDDWPAVRAIYEAGIATGNATFETTAPSWDHWDASHLADHRLVATDRRRHRHRLGRPQPGLGPLRLRRRRREQPLRPPRPPRQRRRHRACSTPSSLGAERAGYWTIQTGIFPENTASLAVHERLGFRIVGRRERIGQLNGVWRDVDLLERRSQRN